MKQIKFQTNTGVVNYHPQSGWLGFSAIGRKGESTSVLSTLNLQPGAKHPVCLARIKKWLYRTCFYAAVISLAWGCAVAPKRLFIKDLSAFYDEGMIISTKTGTVVSFEDLMADLAGVQVVYVGEQHFDPAHHAVQLKIIQAVHKTHRDMAVGMEMFDQSYQSILNQWSSDKLDQEAFIEKTHWYANWKFNFELYGDIFEFIKQENIRLVGLNAPFHIPRKVAVGGFENLLEEDKKYLADTIDTTNEAHRAYVKEVYDQHRVHGLDNFDYFYEAQCVWEDTMAASVALHLKDDMMIVLAGNGHIIRKFGIPDRAFKRNGADFRTIYIATAGSEVESDYADYIWVTSKKNPHHKK